MKIGLTLTDTLTMNNKEYNNDLKSICPICLEYKGGCIYTCADCWNHANWNWLGEDEVIDLITENRHDSIKAEDILKYIRTEII